MTQAYDQRDPAFRKIMPAPQPALFAGLTIERAKLSP